jgi:YidC/Oxa1 family membrane protein insertase
MDRTSRIGVFVCFALLIYLFFYSTPTPPRPRPVTPPPSTLATGTEAPSLTNPPASATPTPVNEQLAFLENDDVKVTFTSLSAAIKEVELKTQKEDKTGKIVLNEAAHSNILQVSGWSAAALNFQATQSPGSLVYTATLPDGVKWVRTYTLGKDYALTVSDTLANPGAEEVTLPAYGLSVGRAEPLRVGGHYQQNSNMYLGAGWLGTKFHLVTISNFNPSSFLWVVKTREPRSVFSSKETEPGPVKWLGVENQFFTVLLTPAQTRPMDHAEFQCFNQRDPASGAVSYAAEPDIEAAAYFPELKVPAGQSVSLDYSLYAGPKEYDRLNALGDNQGELMNYDGVLPFSLLIVPMLRVLHFFHGLVGNYGVAIILLTLCIKAITWPLQSIANHSGKKMQAVGPKLKELQAKYKEQPEKLNTETFALYKEYGVNPFGGCLPAIIQMPVFFSLYFMLQNAVELRGQQFLWVHDLTRPDTVAAFTVAGWHLALNPLPLMVTGLTMVMMRMTPQIGDPQQAKIAQFMPLFFLFIFYNFAAALSLYYVINNCVSIIQIYRNLRKPLPELKRKPKKKA